MKNVGYSELRKSRDKQEETAKYIEDDNVRRMLLFYAVECGAKYQYMRYKGYKLYEEVPEDYKKNKHNIKELLKEIGVGAKCKFPTLVSKHNEKISAGEYQEMWRYGIAIKSEDRKKLDLIEHDMNVVLELLHEIERRK